MIKHNLTGKIFGKLKVLKYSHSDKYGKTHWLCECECGNISTHCGADLIQRNIKSCGCVRKENIIKSITIHGLTKTPLHNTWQNMKQRCYNKNSSAYKDYGGRDIRVCNDWMSFEGFHLWVVEQGIDENCCDKDGNKLTIERKEVDGHYEPNNCCWIPMTDQGLNKRNTIRVLDDDGIAVSLRRYCQTHNLKYRTIKYRIQKLNWSLEKAITTPLVNPINNLKQNAEISAE